ncbi:hypothetical protein Y032_0046g1317 [Ancylostoma ceylanicum]|uniref:Uncharacterized protein n=1 Tax=Ancylostoma ceylanicum TaxID=53326 RepID=A0A016UBC6_9BILA|nr:hypothetical protein Y032_0046g1317 [Ancylostoma ceylanicum]
MFASWRDPGSPFVARDQCVRVIWLGVTLGKQRRLQLKCVVIDEAVFIHPLLPPIDRSLCSTSAIFNRLPSLVSQAFNEH